MDNEENNNGVKRATDRLNRSEESFRKRRENEERERSARLQERSSDNDSDTSIRIQEELIKLNTGVAKSNSGELKFRNKQIKILEQSLAAISDDSERKEMMELIEVTKSGIRSNNSFAKGLTEKLVTHLDSIAGVITGVVADSPLLAGVTAMGIDAVKDKLKKRQEEREQLADFAQEIREGIETQTEAVIPKSEPEDIEKRREDLVADDKKQDALDILSDNSSETVSLLERILKALDKSGFDLADALIVGAGAAAAGTPLIKKMFKGVLKGGIIGTIVGGFFGGIDDAFTEYASTGNMSGAIASFFAGAMETLSFGTLDADKVKLKIVPFFDTIVDVIMTPFRLVKDTWDFVTGELTFNQFKTEFLADLKKFTTSFSEFAGVLADGAFTAGDFLGINSWLKNMNDAIAVLSGFDIQKDTIPEIIKFRNSLTNDTKLILAELGLTKTEWDDDVLLIANSMTEMSNSFKQSLFDTKKSFDDDMTKIANWMSNLPDDTKTFFDSTVPAIDDLVLNLANDIEAAFPKINSVDQIKSFGNFREEERLERRRIEQRANGVNLSNTQNNVVNNRNSFTASGIIVRGTRTHRIE